MHKKVKNENITAEKHIYEEIFWKHFNHQTPLYFIKDLLKRRPAKNEELVNNINDALIDLSNAIIKKNPKNENPNNILQKKSLILITNKKEEYSKY